MLLAEAAGTACVAMFEAVVNHTQTTFQVGWKLLPNSGLRDANDSALSERTMPCGLRKYVYYVEISNSKIVEREVDVGGGDWALG